MQICAYHTDMCVEAIETAGLDGLMAGSLEEAQRRVEECVLGNDGKVDATTFEPMVSLTDHFFAQALRNGGEYLLLENPDGENEGHYCPICEFEKHAAGFDAAAEIMAVSMEMARWARKEHLIARTQ